MVAPGASEFAVTHPHELHVLLRHRPRSISRTYALVAATIALGPLRHDEADRLAPHGSSTRVRSDQPGEHAGHRDDGVEGHTRARSPLVARCAQESLVGHLAADRGAAEVVDLGDELGVDPGAGVESEAS